MFIFHHKYYSIIVFCLVVKLAIMVLGVLNLAPMYLAIFADVGVSLLAILNSLRIMRLFGKQQKIKQNIDEGDIKSE